MALAVKLEAVDDQTVQLLMRYREQLVVTSCAQVWCGSLASSQQGWIIGPEQAA